MLFGKRSVLPWTPSAFLAAARLICLRLWLRWAKSYWAQTYDCSPWLSWRWQRHIRKWPCLEQPPTCSGSSMVVVFSDRYSWKGELRRGERKVALLSEMSESVRSELKEWKVSKDEVKYLILSLEKMSA